MSRTGAAPDAHASTRYNDRERTYQPSRMLTGFIQTVTRHSMRRGEGLRGVGFESPIGPDRLPFPSGATGRTRAGEGEPTHTLSGLSGIYHGSVVGRSVSGAVPRLPS